LRLPINLAVAHFLISPFEGHWRGFAIRKNAATEFIDTKRKPGFGPG
jgi:hypothetical protein